MTIIWHQYESVAGSGGGYKVSLHPDFLLPISIYIYFFCYKYKGIIKYYSIVNQPTKEDNDKDKRYINTEK
jgi:hypothetical protein